MTKKTVTVDGRIKRVFGCISTYTEDFDIKDFMDEVYNDDGRLVLESKQVFIHDETEYGGELKFEYVYMVDVTDIYKASGDSEDKGKVWVDLKLVVLPSSLCKETYDGVASFCGWFPEGQFRITPWDIMDYGLGIPTDNEQIYVPLDEDGEPPYDVIETEVVQDKIKSAIACISGIDRMRGFYLDRAWNMVGTTGWDILKECVLGKDAIGASLDRIKHISLDEI